MAASKGLVFGGFALAFFATAVLIACLALLAVILHNQNTDNNSSKLVPDSSAPPVVKNVLVLADASALVSEEVFSKQLVFAANQLRAHLASTSSCTFRVGILAYDSKLSWQPRFADASDENAVYKLAQEAGDSFASEHGTLDIGKALAGLTPADIAGSSITLIASAQGENFASAVKQATVLKGSGVQIVTVSLTDDGSSLAQLSFDRSCALDGRALAGSTFSQLDALASAIVRLVTPAVGTSTTAPVAPTSTAVITPKTDSSTSTSAGSSLTAATETTGTTEAIGTTKTPKPGYRIMLLVDASTQVPQDLMKKQANFVWTNLLPQLKQFAGANDVGVLTIPYAFDTSADFDTFLPISDEKFELDKYNQVLAAKISKITTFMAPLDVLQIGQAFKRLSEMKEDAIPTHIVTFASGEGDDFGLATQRAKQLMSRAGVSLTTVSLLEDLPQFADISSSPACSISGKGIRSAQSLDVLATQITKCVYPAANFPTKAARKFRSTAVPTKSPPRPATMKPLKAVAKQAIAPETNDLVVLIDASNASTVQSGVTAKLQTNFLNATLLPLISKAQTRLIVAPYAYYISADVQQFYSLSDGDPQLLSTQLHDARIASILLFAPPLDIPQLAPTLKLLNESSLLRSSTVSVLLLANSIGADFDEAKKAAAQLTNAGVRIVAVALDGNTAAFSGFTNSTLLLDGSSIREQNQAKELDLAKSIAALLNPKSELDAKIAPVLIQSM